MYYILTTMSRQVMLRRCEHFLHVRTISFCMLVSCLALLSGCGQKASGPSDPFIATEQSSLATSQLSFPTDGKPLSPAEKRALMSVGAFDKDISARDMYDVMRHFKRYVHTERGTITTGVKNGQKYIAFMRQVMQQKGLPEELVYLAFVESLYRPKARSHTGALGMWQFVSATGKAYGMRQDYWIDERYDIYESTRAAATYLGKLNARFDDWHLAVASYNAGQGKIARGLKATNTKTFFELRRNNQRLKGTKSYLTEENRQYLPKFLAVCKVMRNLESLGFEPMQSTGNQSIVAIGVRPSTDLRALARRSGISWKTFVEHNPAFKRAVSSPTSKSIAYLPRHSVKRAKAYLARATPRTAEGFKGYRIARGDTLLKIARKNGIPISDLRRLNPKCEPLRAGAMLALPRTLADASGKRGTALTSAQKTYVAEKSSRKTSGMPKKSAWQAAQAAKDTKTTSYVVQAKDTVWGISHRNGIHINELRRLNPDCEPLQIGATLALPSTRVGTSGKRGTVLASAQKTVVPKNTPMKTLGTRKQTAWQTAQAIKANKKMIYVVQAKDTIWAIARKFNVKPSTIMELNQLGRQSVIKSGDVLQVAVNQR